MRLLEKDKMKREPFLFGDYLKELRRRKGVSLKEVEKATGVSNAYVSQLENGIRRRIPTAERLMALADYYNVSLFQLVQRYYDGIVIGVTEEELIEKGFLRAISDPAFEHGMRLKNKYNLDFMRFVVEIYEKLIKIKGVK